MQEIDMTAGALLKEETEAGAYWEEVVQNELGVHYVKLVSRQLVGILLCIFIRDEHVRNISEFRVAVQGIGFGGKMGNKGVVGARFKLYETSFCFLSTHLAPHTKNVEKRNQNYHDILQRCVFGYGNVDAQSSDSALRPGDHE